MFPGFISVCKIREVCLQEGYLRNTTWRLFTNQLCTLQSVPLCFVPSLRSILCDPVFFNYVLITFKRRYVKQNIVLWDTRFNQTRCLFRIKCFCTQINLWLVFLSYLLSNVAFSGAHVNKPILFYTECFLQLWYNLHLPTASSPSALKARQIGNEILKGDALFNINLLNWNRKEHT
jgi:hypothetical protein